MTNQTRPPAASEVLASIFASQVALSLRDIISQLGNRSYGLLLLLLAIVNLLPAANVIFGLATSLVGLQLAMQRTQPWLPEKLLNQRLSIKLLHQAQKRLLPKIQHSEKWLKPRWQWTEAAWFDAIIGATLVVLGSIIAIPLPLTNALPAILSGIIALGLLYRDGAMQFIGVISGIATAVFMFKFVSAIGSAVGQYF